MKIIPLLTRTLLLLVILVLSGCLTATLDREFKYTKERISGFYISSDEQTLAVIGDNYHYLFPLQASIKQVLNWDERAKVKANFSQFILLRNSKVAGTYTLRVNKNDIDEPNQTSLKAIGFTDENADLVLNGKMEGIYYSSNNVVKAQSFSHYHEITLAQESRVPLPVKIALTPITVAADGVLLLGGAQFMALFCAEREIGGKKCLRSGFDF